VSYLAYLCGKHCEVKKQAKERDHSWE